MGKYGKDYSEECRERKEPAETWEDGFRPDRGPWKVEIWERASGRIAVVQSDDFHHDVALEITGDFADWGDRLKYAEWLAEKLTAVGKKDAPG